MVVSFARREAPADRLVRKPQVVNASLYLITVGIIDKVVGIDKELQLLLDLLIERNEVLLMRRPNIGQDTERRPYDALET